MLHPHHQPNQLHPTRQGRQHADPTLHHHSHDPDTPTTGTAGTAGVLDATGAGTTTAGAGATGTAPTTDPGMTEATGVLDAGDAGQLAAGTADATAGAGIWIRWPTRITPQSVIRFAAARPATLTPVQREIQLKVSPARTIHTPPPYPTRHTTAGHHTRRTPPRTPRCRATDNAGLRIFALDTDGTGAG